MEIDDTNGYLRKAGHVIVYGSLYWLWFRAFLGSSSRFGSAILWSLGFCLLIAVMDEGHQALLTSRQGRIMDIALDFGAAALVALALSLKRI
jgi:VanZ family protein